MKFNRKLVPSLSVLVLLAAGAAFYILNNPGEIKVENAPEALAGNAVPTAKPKKTLSSLRGQMCDYGATRPLAVMLPSDPITRPLSGIGQADIVIEMPVTPNGVTRTAAFYQCARPKEIGSVRSARDDFIPLIASFNAIYAHWGGEHGALEKLNNRILDNIDAMIYEGTTYYRKKGIARPHNGFTSYPLLESRAKKLGYSFVDTFAGYPRSGGLEYKSQKVSILDIPYLDEFRVQWAYDSKTKAYKRSRDGRPEVDKNTGRQVEADNIVVMETSSWPMTELYLIVKTIGSGPAKVYRNGVVISGTWKKEGQNGRIAVYDNKGDEISLAPGSIWFEFIAP